MNTQYLFTQASMLLSCVIKSFIGLLLKRNRNSYLLFLTGYSVIVVKYILFPLVSTLYPCHPSTAKEVVLATF